jgi:hypothetical protein
MQITVNMDSEQLINVASQMTIDEKLRLYDTIKSDIVKFRFKALLDKFQTNELSEETILKEVEDARSERYKTGH